MTEPVTITRLDWSREAVVTRAGGTGLVSANMPGWSAFAANTYAVRAERSDGSVVVRCLRPGLASTHPNLPEVYAGEQEGTDSDREVLAALVASLVAQAVPGTAEGEA